MSMFIHGTLYDITIKVRCPEGVEDYDPAGVLTKEKDTTISAMLYRAMLAVQEEQDAAKYDVWIYVCEECGADTVTATGSGPVNGGRFHFDQNGKDDHFCEYCEEHHGGGSGSRFCALDLRTARCDMDGSEYHTSCTAFDKWLAWKLRTEEQDEAFEALEDDAKAASLAVMLRRVA